MAVDVCRPGTLVIAVLCVRRRIIRIVGCGIHHVANSIGFLGTERCKTLEEGPDAMTVDLTGEGSKVLAVLIGSEALLYADCASNAFAGADAL